MFGAKRCRLASFIEQGETLGIISDLASFIEQGETLGIISDFL